MNMSPPCPPRCVVLAMADVAGVAAAASAAAFVGVATSSSLVVPPTSAASSSSSDVAPAPFDAHAPRTQPVSASTEQSPLTHENGERDWWMLHLYRGCE